MQSAAAHSRRRFFPTQAAAGSTSVRGIDVLLRDRQAVGILNGLRTGAGRGLIPGQWRDLVSTVRRFPERITAETTPI